MLESFFNPRAGSRQSSELEGGRSSKRPAPGVYEDEDDDVESDDELDNCDNEASSSSSSSSSGSSSSSSSSTVAAAAAAEGATGSGFSSASSSSFSSSSAAAVTGNDDDSGKEEEESSSNGQRPEHTPDDITADLDDDRELGDDSGGGPMFTLRQAVQSRLQVEVNPSFAGEKWLLGLFEGDDWWLRRSRLWTDRVFERLGIEPSHERAYVYDGAPAATFDN